MPRLAEVDVPDLPEPTLGRASRLALGRGTVGLGRYAEPLAEIHRHEQLGCYLDSIERRREVIKERTVGSSGASGGATSAGLVQEQSLRVRAAQERRLARHHAEEKKRREMAELGAMRAALHDEALAEAQRRREEQKLRIESLLQSKRMMRETNNAYKEEQRREHAHQRLDRQEMEAKERAQYDEERQKIAGQLRRKVNALREETLRSRKNAVEVVQSLQHRSRETAHRDKQIIARKLKATERDLQADHRNNVRYAQNLRKNHHQVMEKNAHQWEEFLEEKRKETKQIYPTAEAITASREAQLERNQAHCLEEREARRARTAELASYDE